MCGKLALDTAGTVAASQLLDLSNSNHVVVAFDGVLQSGSSNSKLNSFLGGLAVQQGVDQAAAEGVTAATRSMMRSSYFLLKQYSLEATSYSMALQPLSEAEWLSRRVIATFSKPNLSASCLATLL